MYVCPQMRNIYSSTCLRIQSTFFNETNTLQQALEPQTQTHSVSEAFVLPVYCTLTRHPGAKTYVWSQKKVHVCKKNPKKTTTMQKSKRKQKKLLTNRFVFQSMRGAELCMQKTRNAKKQNHTMQYPWSLRSVCKTINYCQQISTSIETAFMH